MGIEIKVPVLPESVANATVSTWHKQPGDQVSEGENLVDLETDKVVLEVPAPADGILDEIVESDNAIVVANQVLATFTEATIEKPVLVSATQTEESAPSEAAPPIMSNEDLSPSVRRMVAEKNIDIDSIKGSGKGGRILKKDVETFLQQNSATTQSNTATPLSNNRIEERVPMSRLRARIAERLVQVQQHAAILTTFNEVNLQPVMDLRTQYKDMFAERHGTKLGFMSFFTKAAIAALQRFPSVNAAIDGTDIIYHGYQDIGIAVSSDRGLVVPVLRNAEKMSFADIERSIRELSGKARDGKLSMEEITGGTFTITNGGIFGSLLSTPIINAPQSAILGMHAIKERPVAVNGEVEILPMMYIALSYDHRIIDGKDSVQFLAVVKELLEDPARLLLEV